MGTAFCIVKREQGVLSRWRISGVAVAILTLALALSFLERVGLREFGWQMSHYPFILQRCFTGVLMWGGLVVGILALCPSLLSASRRTQVLLATGLFIGSLAGYMSLAATTSDVDQWYPLLVWFVSFRAAPMLGIPCFFLVSASTWGIRIEDSVSAEVRKQTTDGSGTLFIESDSESGT